MSPAALSRVAFAFAFVHALAIALGCEPTEFAFVPDEADATSASSTSAAASSVGSGGGATGSGGAGAGAGGGDGGDGGRGGAPCTPANAQTLVFEADMEGWAGQVFEGGTVGYQYLEVGCIAGEPTETRRSFLHFATESLPDDAVVLEARLRLCSISYGGPGGVVIYDVAFGLPVDHPDYDASVTDLGAQTAAAQFGPIAIELPTSAVDAAAPSQLALRYDDEPCARGTGYRRFATDGDHPGESCPAPSDAALEIKFCE